MAETPQPDTASGNPRLRHAVPALPAMLGFGFFNALTMQIVVGAPLVLLASLWGASAAYIGAVTGLLPLMVTSQLLVAQRIEAWSYRRVLLIGWVMRLVALCLLLVLTLLDSRLEDASKRAVLFGLIFAFDLAQGLTSAAWPPWLTRLVPSQWRGRYVSFEQVIANLGAAMTLFFCGWLLSESPSPPHFGMLYCLAVLGGFFSLLSLKSIREDHRPVERQPRLPLHKWAGAIIKTEYVRKVLLMNAAFGLSMAAWGTFTILFLKEELHFPERVILYMTAASTLGAMLSAWIWGFLADRFGSRPVIHVIGWSLSLVMGLWMLMALRLLPSSRQLVFLLFVLVGALWIGYIVAGGRYTLNNAPEHRPVLSLTLIGALTNLSFALTPFCWGWVLQWLRDVHFTLGDLRVDRFTIFYLLLSLTLLMAIRRARMLPESEAHRTRAVLFYMVNDFPMRRLNMMYQFLLQRRESDLARGRAAGARPGAVTATRRSGDAPAGDGPPHHPPVDKA